MIFWELIGNTSQNQWDFLTIDGDTPLAGMYGIPTCRNILRITLHEEISPISGESRPLLVWDVFGFFFVFRFCAFRFVFSSFLLLYFRF